MSSSSPETFDLRLDSLLQVFSGLQNPYTGMGNPYVDPTQHTWIQPGLSRLSRQEQSALVRQSGLLKKLTTNLPKAATWRWGRTTLATGNAKLLQAIADAVNGIPVVTPLQRIGKTRKGYQVAGELALQTGNSGFILDVDDGRKLDEPLNRKNIKRINKLALLSRHTLRPDISTLSDGLPEHFIVLNAYNLKEYSNGQRIHRSRVHWFRGVPILDDFDLIANNGCDDSILELVRDAWYLYQPAVQAAGRMLTDFDVPVRKVKDLAQNLADRGDEYKAELQSRLQVDQISRSNYRTQVIDMDNEALDNWTRQVSGMSDLYDRVKENLLGSIEPPPAVVFGEFASGLNSTGKSTTEKQLWNEAAAQFQIDKYDDNIQELQEIVCLCKDGPTNGNLPEGLGWEWLSPYSPDAAEQADLELKRAQLIQDLNSVDQRFGKVAIAATYGQKEYSSTITLPKPYADALQRDIKEESKPQPTEPDVSALQGDQPGAEDQQTSNTPDTEGGDQPGETDQQQQDEAIADDILNDRTLLDSADSDRAKIDAVYAKYHSVVNMSASELEAWSRTKWSKMASLDRSPIQRNLRLLRKPKAEWTMADVATANRTISFVSRMKGAGKGEPVSADAPVWMTHRFISLKNWARDLRKRTKSDSDDTHLDASRAELLAKAKAKNEGLEKGKKFNTFGKSNAQIAEFVGEGVEQKATKATAKPKNGTQKGKYQTKQTSSAIAQAIAKKTGADPSAIEQELRGKIQKAIDKTRREARKAGKEPTEKELRAAAVAVVKVEARSAIAAARGEGKPQAEAPAKAPAKQVEEKQGRSAKAPKAEPKTAEAVTKGKAKDKAKGAIAEAKPKESAPVAEKDQGETKVKTPVTESTAKAEPQKASSKQVKVNQAALDAQRSQLVKEAGEETVTAAEKAVKSILSSKETGVFVKVGSNDTLSRIIGDRFRNSVELGTEASVPGLEGSYQDARKRVEKEVLGYDVNHNAAQRPIYAYYGSQNLKSPTHEDTAPFGEVTIKLKDDVKQRSTFTGADSFKSGIASKVDNPNAASLIQSTKHGKAIVSIDAKGTLSAVGQAKDVDSLFKALPTDGGKYIEAQIHGQVKPEDIAELHYSSKTGEPIPSPSVIAWAKTNGVKIYQDGKPYEQVKVSEARRKEIANTITPQQFADYLEVKAFQNRDKGIEGGEKIETAKDLKYDQWKVKVSNEIQNDPNYIKDINSGDKKRQDAAKRRLKNETNVDRYAHHLENDVNNGESLSEEVANYLQSKAVNKYKTGFSNFQMRSLLEERNLNQLLSKSKSNKEKREQEAAAAQKEQDRINSIAKKNEHFHKEIDAILSSPLLDENEIKGYKPMMSKEEAEAYTKNSAVSGIEFYHGGSKEAVNSITTGGVKISVNSTGIFGGGFYMGISKRTAENYATGKNEEQGLYVSTSVKMKNPATFDSASDYSKAVEKLSEGVKKSEKLNKDGTTQNDFYEAFGNRFGDANYGFVSAMLKLKGYDGVYIKNNGYLVALQREQVVSHAINTPRTADQLSQIDIAEAAPANTPSSTLGQNKQYQELAKRLKTTKI